MKISFELSDAEYKILNHGYYLWRLWWLSHSNCDITFDRFCYLCIKGQIVNEYNKLDSHFMAKDPELLSYYFGDDLNEVKKTYYV